MLEKIIRFSLKHRWFVLLFTLVIAALGVYNFQRLPIDAVPDITNVQVQINTQASGYSPFEVEQRITFPIELAMSGLPNLDYTRSLSRYGLSQVTVVFKDGTNIYFARQLINERLQEVRDKLPPEAETTLGPISTGLGEIFMYTVTNKPNVPVSSVTIPLNFVPFRIGLLSLNYEMWKALRRSIPLVVMKSNFILRPIP